SGKGNRLLAPTRPSSTRARAKPVMFCTLTAMTTKSRKMALLSIGRSCAQAMTDSQEGRDLLDVFGKELSAFGHQHPAIAAQHHGHGQGLARLGQSGRLHGAGEDVAALLQVAARVLRALVDRQAQHAQAARTLALPKLLHRR